MKYALSFLCIISALNVYSQSFCLRNAINAFKIENIRIANQQIERARLHPQTSRWANTWNYYFLINERNYELDDNKVNNTTFVMNMVEGFSKCKSLDTDSEYILTLRPKLEKVGQFYQKNAELQHSNGDFSAFIKSGKVSTDIHELLESQPPKEFYFMLAESNEDLNDLEAAAIYYQRSIDIDYKSELSYAALVDVLVRLNRNDEADAKYYEAKNLFKDGDVFLLIEIEKLMEDGLYFKARTYLNEAIQQRPNQAKLHYFLGEVCSKMSLKDEAISAYLRASELDRNDFNTNIEIGKYYLTEGKITGNDSILNLSKKHLEKADSINPKSKELLVMLEDLYLELRDLSKYKQIRNRNSGN